MTLQLTVSSIVQGPLICPVPLWKSVTLVHSSLTEEIATGALNHKLAKC